MDDLTKLLEGSDNDVKARLVGRSHDDLLKLKALEQQGKGREVVLAAIDASLNVLDEHRAGGTTVMTTAGLGLASALDTSGAADLAAADDFSPSGAPRQVTEIDVSHPAVDNDPRAGTTVNQNRIDFNDPTISGREAVEQALKTQG